MRRTGFRLGGGRFGARASLRRRRIPGGAWIWGCAGVLGWGVVSAPAYAPGTTNRIEASGTSGASYMLYLPTSYRSNHPPPLMVYFDPGADSGYGLRKLQPSCEAAGWVLACANDLRNGGIPDEAIVLREIMDDVRRRIPHDRRRFYLAGLSGGSWRAQTAAREYWNEAAGVLLFGCWIGDYDDYTVFPDRLAIARVNGSTDLPPAKDMAYYARSSARVHDVVFDGGHEIGPVAAVSEAMAWLDEDFANVGESHVPADFEAGASSLVAAAQAAWAGGDCDLVVRSAASAMHRYPMSSSVREAERLLFLVFTNEALRAGVRFDAEPSEAWAMSWMLMERGLGTDTHFPASFAQAYFEAAIRACPTNARALAECAHQILRDPARDRREWPRAAELAGSAFLLKPNHWRAPHVLHELAARTGDLRGALSRLKEALKRMPGDLGNDALSRTYVSCKEVEARYEEQVAEIPPLPLPEDFERMPMGRSVAGRRGWTVPWGEATLQTQGVHNGLCALSVAGRQSLVFLNCEARTNETVWIDFYLRPALGGMDFTNPLPPLATAVFHVRSDGLLRAFDGVAGGWTTLTHDPLPAGQWSRLSVRADCASRRWSLFLNDREVADGLGFAHSNAVFSGFCLLHDGDTPSLVDDLTISANAPLADGDRDGLPDAWEDAFGLNPDDPSDSGLDPDGDLYATCEEHRLGTSPTEWDPPPPSTGNAMLIRSDASGLPGELRQTNVLHRHHRWEGDLMLVAADQAQPYFATGSGAEIVWWGAEEAVALTPPCSGVAKPGYERAGNLTLQGPLNALYHVMLDGSTGEFSIDRPRFRDEDGDTMMDEWELLFSGSATGLTPYGNPDGDAYPNLAEYFRNTDPLRRDPYSGYATISLATSFNGWSTTCHYMTLVGDHVWLYPLGGNNGSYLYKFVANSSWDVNWGDNQQSVASGTFRDTADRNGANILLNLTNSMPVTLVFHDLTRKYAFVSRAHDADGDGIPDDWEVARYTNLWMYGASDDPDGDGWVNVAEYLEDTDPFAKNAGLTTNASVSVAGNFSGWNLAANRMEPAGNHVWRLDMAFHHLDGAEFKFVANGSWATAWGAPDAAAFALPLQAVGDARGGGSNFKSAAPLDGVYRFTFNEAAALCTLDYAPQHLLHQAPEWTDFATRRALVLRWLSSSDRTYGLYRYTNLLSDPERLGAGIRATPPLNVFTQAIDPDMPLGVFQIRLEE